MGNITTKIGICAFAIHIFYVFSVQGAEVRLRNMPVQSTNSLVTLADIADVLPMGNENVDWLRQIVLFPTPATESTRILDQWEVRTMLSQQGVNSLHHFISGAEKITVIGSSPNMASPDNEQFVIQANYLTPAGTNSVTPAVRSQAALSTLGLPDESATQLDVKLLECQVVQALNIYLNYTNKIERSWDISLKLTPEQAKQFSSNGQIVEITGGQIPFTGQQQFQIRMQSNVSVAVDAMVKLPAEVVIVRRALPKGYIISESDVMLQRAGRIGSEDFFVDVQSVVGKETTKSLKEWSPLTQSVLRQPLWVHRGDIITVRVVNGGIVVRTEVIALQDGVQGDTITVSRIDLSAKKGKKESPVTYLARVCAPKTVEVCVKN